MKREINLFDETLSSSIREEKSHEENRTSLAMKQQEKLIFHQIKRIVEALLFASSEPLPFEKIKEVISTFYQIKSRLLMDLIAELQQEYLMQQRAFRLEEIGQGFILRTCEEYKSYIDLLFQNKKAEKLSQPSLEVLAIIAYRQPITRPQIEAIRGVDCSGAINSLLEREMVQAMGKLEAPGRPILYGVTKNFLKHFGLKDAQELPFLPSTITESVM